MSPVHVRPFLVEPLGPGPTLRLVARAPTGAAREGFRRLGTDWPLLVVDRELGDRSTWWVPENGGKPAPLHRCSCGAPVRPTGQRGRPFETCTPCRGEAA